MNSMYYMYQSKLNGYQYLWLVWLNDAWSWVDGQYLFILVNHFPFKSVTGKEKCCCKHAYNSHKYLIKDFICYSQVSCLYPVPLPEWNSGDIFDGVLLGGGSPNTSLLEVHHSLCVQYDLWGFSRPPKLNTLRSQKIKYCNKALNFLYRMFNCWPISQSLLVPVIPSKLKYDRHFLWTSKS